MNLERYVKVIDGEECLSAEAMGILAGLTADEVRAEAAIQDAVTPGRFVVPKSWRRGAKEQMAKYGTRSAAEILARVLAERGELDLPTERS